MNWLEWCIVILPLIFIVGMAFYSRRFVRGVADFLAAGRVAGRYVISVAGLESSLGVLTLIAMVEVNYQTGFALGFWNGLLLPLGMVLSLTGYCLYRFRETKALSLGQFLEIRYSRSFRIFASILRTFSEMLCNCIGPAVAARFFIYLFGFPHTVNLFGLQVSTFVILLIVLLSIALTVILTGGMISLIVTDCVQGLICYPIFVILTVFILTNFSWSSEIAPVMLDRVAGENFLNPYDIQGLRDFNLFALVVSLFATVLNRAVWYGGGTTGAGRTPHEQKMAGILGTWRGGFAFVMCLLLAIMLLTVMGHRNFAGQAHRARIDLTAQVAAEVEKDPVIRKKLIADTAALPVNFHQIGTDRPFSRQDNADAPYLNSVRKTLGNQENGNATYQKFHTLYHQMMLPVIMRHFLPPFLLALLALLGLMLMISTDDSRIFNSAMAIIQDIVVPLHRKSFTARQQLTWLRIATVFVAIVFFFGSLFLSQLDYINLFCTITASIWVGGAGSVMVFGLYSRFGTTAGAYASLLTGALFSGGGILLQRNWTAGIYPWLAHRGWVDALDNFLIMVSSPFSPYIVWTMDPLKFPVNSMEIYFLAMIFSVAAYCLVSFLTYRQPFNLDRMLHRNKYCLDGTAAVPESPWTWKNFYQKLIGITSDYTTGDKIITWSVFGYTFVYQFILCFVLVVIWNTFSPWPIRWWSHYFLITSLMVPCAAGAVTTVWFMVGGIVDLRRLFVDLRLRQENPLDNGQVDGHVSLADKAELSHLDQSSISDNKGN